LRLIRSESATRLIETDPNGDQPVAPAGSYRSGQLQLHKESNLERRDPA
jgi:hypothetical protein